MAKFLPDSWRAILRTRISDRLDKVDEDLRRQEREKEEIVALQTEIENLESKAAGEPCKHCGHKQDEPSSSEMDDIQRKIVEAEKEIDRLEKSRIDPDPLTLMKKQDSLRNMGSELYLDSLVDFENDILRYQNELRKAAANLKKAEKLLSADAKKDVQKKLHDKDILREKIGDLKGALRDSKEFLTDWKTRREKAAGPTKFGWEEVKTTRKRIKLKIAGFPKCLGNEVDSYRENAFRVESRTSLYLN